MNLFIQEQKSIVHVISHYHRNLSVFNNDFEYHDIRIKDKLIYQKPLKWKQRGQEEYKLVTLESQDSIRLRNEVLFISNSNVAMEMIFVLNTLFLRE